MSPNAQNTHTLTSLSKLKRNERGRVISMAGGEGMRSKMHQLGIHGAEILRVAQNPGFGPLVVEVRGTRLIIGRKMADRLWVSRI